MKEKKVQDDDRWKRNARPAIYFMAGVYVLIMAYNIIEGISCSIGSERIIMIVSAILFVIIGAAMVFFGMFSVYRNTKRLRGDMKKTEQ